MKVTLKKDGQEKTVDGEARIEMLKSLGWSSDEIDEPEEGDCLPEVKKRGRPAKKED